uniref:hypothetical protein n=1 Tax=Agathobacter sp. TaxID=2021311 RepID=UPI004056905A
MQDKNKTQPKAFRITEETAEKFKEIAQSLGANQQQAMAKLIEVYEMESGKESLPEMRENIDVFEGYVRAATSMYMQALESNRNMRALVRTEYEGLLKSKDTTIGELQERVENAEAAAKTISEKEKEYQNSIAKLEKEKIGLEKEVEKAFAESKEKTEEWNQKYDTLNKSYEKLQESEQELKSMLSSFMKDCEKLKTENTAISEEKRTKEKAFLEVTYKNEALMAELEKVKRMAEEEIRRQKDTFAHEKEKSEITYQLALQMKENEMKEVHKKEMDEIRKELERYKDLYYRQKLSN